MNVSAFAATPSTEPAGVVVDLPEDVSRDIFAARSTSNLSVGNADRSPPVTIVLSS